MKSVIIATILVIGNAAAVEREPGFGNPTAIIKAGVGSDVRSFGIALQTKTCFLYKHCFNPAFVHLSLDGDERTSTNGIGIDYMRKVPGASQNGYFLNAGIYLFDEKFHPDDASGLNLHAGVGMEYKHIIISADVYGNPFFHSSSESDSYLLFNVGYRF